MLLPEFSPDSLQESVLSADRDGVRLDLYVSEKLSLSRTRAADLIGKDLVLVNGTVEKKNFLLSAGDEIRVYLPEDREIDVEPENIPLDVVYEDAHLIVVNKPRGMVVHPAPGNYEHTLVNALLWHCRNSLSGINGKLRPGIVHRIDQFTSGLLVAAKSDEAHQGLSVLFQNHDFTRRYHAVVYGVIRDDAGTVVSGIGRSRTDRKKMASYPVDSPNTKRAVTHYRVLERYAGYTYIECALETGRTHQIRVHMSSLGHPILDDHVYAPGRKSFGLPGQCLHAKELGFRHPITGEELSFDSPLPDDFRSVLERLRKDIP